MVNPRPTNLWNRIYSLSFKTQREVKIQSLQYKLLHRIIPCNVYLHRIKIKESNLCDYCSIPDDITHFFCHCAKTYHLWKSIFNWYNKTSTDPPFFPAEHEIIFGILESKNRKDTKILNVIILLTKNYIHCKRLYHQANLCISEWLLKLRSWIYMENKLPYRKGSKEVSHLWDNILTYLG